MIQPTITMQTDYKEPFVGIDYNNKSNRFGSQFNNKHGKLRNKDF